MATGNAGVTHSIVGGDLNGDAERKEALYRIFASRDARFDGQVFVGVSSTKIYCRPVCPYQPKAENCTFYRSAAEAERDGYRPCLVCRPELAPGMAPVDSSASLAKRAATYLREHCTCGEGMEGLAGKLGYTDRHLRRVFQEEYNVTPLQYLTTCRLQLAKALLVDSSLPISEVALASGFKSVRRFNDAFRSHYRLTPTRLRKEGRSAVADAGVVRISLGYRPPYRFDEVLGFFRSRQLDGVELVDDESYMRTVRIALADGDHATGWIRVSDDAEGDALVLEMSESLLSVTSQVVARVRRQFDTESSPADIHAGIACLDDVAPGARVEGTRLPGCFEGFETICRAILGQQISVANANRLAAKIVAAHGVPVETGVEGLTHAFPTPSEMLALDDIEEALGILGVIRTRSRGIRAIAQMIEDGGLSLDSCAPVDEQLQRLLSVKGIGPWTANYIAMRVYSYPDAFLETDAGIRHALAGLEADERLASVESARPWRSYANISLWNHLVRQTSDATGDKQEG